MCLSLTMVRADFDYASPQPQGGYDDVNWSTMEEICDLSKCSIGLVYNIICNYGDFRPILYREKSLVHRNSPDNAG